MLTLSQDGADCDVWVDRYKFIGLIGVHVNRMYCTQLVVCIAVPS